jgi:polyribonucleotide nucleotidyltransferase
MDILVKEQIDGKTLSIQAGKVAKQASGSVVVQYGDTIVLVTVVSAHEERQSNFCPCPSSIRKKYMPPAASRAIIFDAKLAVPVKKRP